MSINVHGTCVRLGRAGRSWKAPANTGVLILGPSGAGKSDLALRLLTMGAGLVADDRVELFAKSGRLCARSPASIRGRLEVRGVGIVPVSPAQATPVFLAVRIATEIERMPEFARYEPPGLAIAEKKRPLLIELNPFEASAPDKILVAAVLAHQMARGSVK